MQCDPAPINLSIRLYGNIVAEERRILSEEYHPLGVLANTTAYGDNKAAELAHKA